jgi:exodeoxyribonuclease V alpha subunit
MSTLDKTSESLAERQVAAEQALASIGWDAPAGIQFLYSQALAAEGVTLTDCQTIRDLLRISGLVGTATDKPALHALLLALLASRNQGSLCLPLTSVVLRQTFVQLGFDEDAEALADAVLAESLTHYAPLIAMQDTDTSATRPLVVDASGAEPRLYLSRYYVHERSLRQRILNLLATDGASAAEPPSAELLASCCTYNDYSLKKDYCLNAEQMHGVYLALSRKFMIVGGGPGTGKTTLVCSLLRGLLHSGVAVERIRLVAPTGRAAARLGEAIQEELGKAKDESEDVVGAISQMSGSTVHWLLRYNPNRHAFMYSSNNHLPIDVLIVDEVSMVDVVLMDRLLGALAPETQVIFLGDPHQLPSVEAGAILADLFPPTGQGGFSPQTADELAKIPPREKGKIPLAAQPGPLTDRVVMLTETHRFKGDLKEACARINSGESDIVRDCYEDHKKPLTLLEPGKEDFNWPPRKGQAESLEAKPACPQREAWTPTWLLGVGADSCCFLDASDKPLAYLRDLLFSWTYDHFIATDSYFELCRRSIPDEDIFDGAQLVKNYSLNKIFQLLGSAQILTAVRNGPYGAAGISQYLLRLWRPKFDAKGHDLCFAGSPVMVTRNHSARQLYNGDVGVVLRSKSGRYVAVFRRGQEYLSYPYESLPEHQSALACTVHKSQGSQYGRVLMVLPEDENHRLLNRQILYTGITRAKHSASIYATPGALEKCIKNEITRHSGLDFWGGGRHV